MTGEYPEPPSLPIDEQATWTLVETSRETLFEVGPVGVYSTTVRYEDRTLRETLEARLEETLEARLEELLEADWTWRFLFVTRLTVPGASGRSSTLQRIVTTRAGSAFVDRLQDRGVDGVSAEGERSFRVGDVDGTAVRYRGTVGVAGQTLEIRGWLAVRPEPYQSGFLLVGGAYPTDVTGTGAVAQTIREFVDPEAFEDEFFSVVRGVE